MDEKITNIIPTIMAEIASDGENESRALLNYYTACTSKEKSVLNDVLIYLCGWSFETILKKCGFTINKNGEVQLNPRGEA
jgi:hypothetical protein